MLLYKDITNPFWNFVNLSYRKDKEKIKHTPAFQVLCEAIKPNSDGVRPYLFITDDRLNKNLHNDLIPSSAFKTRLLPDTPEVFVFEDIDNVFLSMKEMLDTIGEVEEAKKINTVIEKIYLYEDMEDITEQLKSL